MPLTTSITHLGEQVGRLVPANNSTLMCVTVKSPLSDYGDPSDLPEWCVAAAKNKKTKLALCIRWMMVFHEILPLTLVSPSWLSEGPDVWLSATCSIGS